LIIIKIDRSKILLAAFLALCAGAALYFLFIFNDRAIIRATFEDELSHGYMAKTYFLSINHKMGKDSVKEVDIDDELLCELSQQVSMNGITLRKLSDAIATQDSSSKKLARSFTYGYYDKLTRERGSTLTVGPVKWILPWKAEVDVSWYFGILSGAWGTVTVVYGLHGWKVVDYESKGIS